MSQQPESAPVRPSRFTPSELRAWKGLLAVHAQLVGELGEALEAEHRLSIAEYELLLTLAGTPGRSRTMRELTERAYLTQSGLSRLVDRLETRGHVRREVADGDRRSVRVSLTDDGYRLWRRAHRGHVARVRRCFLDHLDGDELDRLGNLWVRVAPDAGL